jgi:hypothetical protein
MSQFNAVPPMYGEPDFGAEPPAWPKVVGIISIVWASLGLICNGCTAVSALVQPMLISMVPPEQQQQMQQQMAGQNVAFNIVIGILGFLLSALLLYAGIQTMRYQWKGRTLHLVWAALAILIGLIGSFIGFGAMKQQVAAQMQQMQSDPNMAAQAQQMQGGIEAFAYAIFGCTVLFSLAYPAFTLIWFGLIKTREEQMGQAPQELVA